MTHQAREHGERAADGAADGVEHLQRAAGELIAAARSFLDAAEDLVEDRDLLAETVGAVRGFAREMGAHVERSARASDDADLQHEAPEHDAGPDQDDVEESENPRNVQRSARVRRIHVE